MAVALICRCTLRAVGLQALLTDLGAPPIWSACTIAEARRWFSHHPPPIFSSISSSPMHAASAGWPSSASPIPP